MDTVQHEVWHTIVGLHRFINDLCNARVIAHQEPRIHADAMPANARPRLENIDAGMHIADADDLIHIHVIMAAYFCQFVGKGNIHSTESIFDNLSHFSRTDIRHDDFTLTEGCVEFLDPFTNGFFIRANCTIVVQKLIDHVAGNDAFWRMHQVNVFTNFEAISFNCRANIFVDCSRRNGGFDYNSRALGTHIHHIFHGRDHIAGVHLLAEFIVGRRNRHDIGIRYLIFRRKANTRLDRFRKELVQPFFLKRGPARIQRSDQIRIVIRSNDIHPVRRQHKRSRQTNVAKTDDVNHNRQAPFLLLLPANFHFSFFFC